MPSALPRRALVTFTAGALALVACSGDPTGPGGGALTPGVAVTIRGGSDSERYFTVEVPAGAPALHVTLSGGSGDADLYVRFGSRPEPGTFDCGSDFPATGESCLFVAPAAGTWHIAVIGFDAYQSVSLLASTESPTTELTSGVPLTGRSGPADSFRYFSINVPTGRALLRVTTSGGTGDVDILVRREVPRFDTVDCLSFNSANDELCEITAPAAGTWYILLLGWDAYAGVTLTATAVVDVAPTLSAVSPGPQYLGACAPPTASSSPSPSSASLQPGSWPKARGATRSLARASGHCE